MAVMKHTADNGVSKRVALLVSTILLSWIPTSQILATAVILVPIGRIADIYGSKRIFTYGILITTVSSLLSAYANSGVMLLVFRVLQGMGNAMTFSTGIVILTSVYPIEERGKVLGINVSSVYLGLSLGPFLGGILTQQFGWRSTFLVIVPLGAMVFAAVMWKLKGEWRGAKGKKFDLPGSMIYGAAIVSLMYGLSQLPSASGVGAIAAGAMGTWIFIRWEMRVDSPLLDMDLFRKNTVFAFSNLAALINYGATFAVAFLLSLYLQHIKGFSPQLTGLVLVSMPVVQTVFSPLAGKLSDKVEPRLIVSAGMAFTTVGLLLLRFLDKETSLVYILVSLAILGFGFALFSSPNVNAIMSSVAQKSYAIASATLATTRQMGMMLSMGVVMLIFTLHMGGTEIKPENYPDFLGSVRTAFDVFTVLCFGGIFASLARGKVR
jgi:EmrB/QacA subfamily drug resistance transporter